jgi:hypothetical protein
MIVRKGMEAAEANAGGILTIALTALFKVYEMVTFEDINNALQLTMVLLGMIFLFYRIKGQILDNKIKTNKIDEKTDNKNTKEDS